jgi:hypothetical protein
MYVQGEPPVADALTLKKLCQQESFVHEEVTLVARASAGIAFNLPRPR